jgi:hypothetical protein
MQRYALHFVMSALDYTTQPSFECPDTDSSDVAFIRATGRYAIEEYLTCNMYPLSTSFGFDTIVDGETLMLKVTVLLPEFCIASVEGESNDRFLVTVELEAENVVEGYSRAKHDADLKCLPSGGCLNPVFEKARIAYASRLQPSTDASAEAARKRKAEAYDKSAYKRAKVAAKKTIPSKVVAGASKRTSIPLKATTLKGKSGVKMPSDRVCFGEGCEAVKKVLLLRLSQMLLTDQITNGGAIG